MPRWLLPALITAAALLAPYWAAFLDAWDHEL